MIRMIRMIRTISAKRPVKTVKPHRKMRFQHNLAGRLPLQRGEKAAPKPQTHNQGNLEPSVEQASVQAPPSAVPAKAARRSLSRAPQQPGKVNRAKYLRGRSCSWPVPKLFPGSEFCALRSERG